MYFEFFFPKKKEEKKKNANASAPLNFGKKIMKFGMDLDIGHIKPPTKGISWEEKHRGEMNFTTKKILEKQKSLQVKSKSPDKFLR